MDATSLSLLLSETVLEVAAGKKEREGVFKVARPDHITILLHDGNKIIVCTFIYRQSILLNS